MSVIIKEMAWQDIPQHKDEPMYFTGKGGEPIRDDMEIWMDATGRFIARSGNHLVAVAIDEKEAREGLKATLTFNKDPQKFRHQ
jgi:hypothetical protein